MRTVGQLNQLLSSYIKPGQTFIVKLNQALQALYDKGNWKDLMAEYRVEVSAGYFCLPPDFDSVLMGRINDCPLEIMGMSYEYKTRGPGPVFHPAGTAFGLIDKGYVSLLSDIPIDGLDALNFELISGAYASGDTITIDYNTTVGPVSTTLSPVSGTSVTLTPTDPITSIESITFASLPARVVVKDDNDYLYAILLPADGVSRYRRYDCPQVTPNTTDEWIVDALVKRAFIPATTLTDKIYLDNIPAIKHALLAVTYEDAADEDRATLNWQKALDILNNELSQVRGGAKQIPQFEPFGPGQANVQSLYSGYGWGYGYF